MKKATERPLLEDIRTELGALGAELREQAVARWELARLEIEADLHGAKRLAIAWLAAALMATTALPLAAVALAELLDGCGSIARSGWMLIFAGILVILASGAGFLAWRRFRRRFVGLQETLEELREDLAWLKEKAEGGRRKAEGESGE